MGAWANGPPDPVVGHRVDLPDATRDWIRERSGWVASGGRAHTKISSGHDAERRAQTHLEAGELDQAITALDEALSAYKAVDPESPLGPQTNQALAELRTKAYDVLVGEALHLTAVAPPEFSAALMLINRAQDHTTSHEQRVELRSMRAACLRYQQDMATCRRAVRILTQGIAEAYPEALALLNSIDPRSHASAEARMWSEWLEADADTRRADRLYAEGDARSALGAVPGGRPAAADLHGAGLPAPGHPRPHGALRRYLQAQRRGDPHLQAFAARPRLRPGRSRVGRGDGRAEACARLTG